MLEASRIVVSAMHMYNGSNVDLIDTVHSVSMVCEITGTEAWRLQWARIR